MEQKEDLQLNIPAKKYFGRKLRCDVARVGFSFSAGELDVLAYNRKHKLFHVCEGKRSSNVASIGHAIGQLIGYISMIQDNGYDFLNRISKEEKLELTDFSDFLEKRSINICFYIVLPREKKSKLFGPAQLILKNLGDFGSSIGIFFASKNSCELAVEAKPLPIKIRRVYSRDDFLSTLNEKFLDMPESKGLIWQNANFPHLSQFKEVKGNPFLHFEVCFRRKLKSEDIWKIEIAFHLELAKAHLKNTTGTRRKRWIQKTMARVFKGLKKSEHGFKYKSNWGKRWSKLFTIYTTSVLDDESLNKVLDIFKLLVSRLKPKLDDMHWGRMRDVREI